MFPPMATRVRSSSPHTEPFPLLDTTPRTPTSLSSVSQPAFSASRENPYLPKPHIQDYSSLSPKSPPRLSPKPLTGVAALVGARRQRQQKDQESRQTSPNPAAVALNALTNSPAMSKPSDNPQQSSLGEQMRRPSQHLSVPVTTAAEASQPSPVSLRNFGNPEHISPAGATTANILEPSREPHLVAEPADIPTGSTYPDPARSYAASTATATNNSHKAFTYPGPPQHTESSETQARASPSTKRHKCPYCATDFTRHHNLKSHLLTHSQEKPYVCQTCQSRFRRLHDLKRHTKLHTGERPHTCDKCGRRFARGDALARHNKGPGGCAGRRSSFGGDEDSRLGDDNMDGLEYAGEHGEDDNDPEDDEEENMRRGSEPNRKRAHLETPHDAERTIYRQHSSTYPPIAGRVLSGSMGPPNAILPSSSTVTSPGEIHNANPPGNMTSHSYGPPGVVLSEGGLHHSPKPLSPGQHDHHHQHRLSVAESSMLRNRSPSLTQQIQQAHITSRGQASPGQLGSQLGPQLPSLAGLASAESARLGHQPGRLPLQPAAHNILQHPHNVQPGSLHGSNPGSLSSHGHSSGGSIRDIAGDNTHDMWNYIRSLEQRFSRMQDEYELRISRLQEDLIAIKGHLSFQSR